MKTSSTKVSHPGKYFPRPVPEGTRLHRGADTALSWISATEEPLLFVGDANTLAALRRVGACPRRCDTVVDLGAPARLDDELVARAASAAGSCTKRLVVVGGGTMNDLGKLLAAERRAPFVLVATCASMNGWLSANASVVRGGNKASVPAVAPSDLVLDDVLLRSAPPELTAAGVADALSGLYACRDWAIAHGLDGSAHDAGVAAAVTSSTEALVRAIEGGAPDDAGAWHEALLDALLVGGIAMSEAHSSAPASGAEHLVAHAIDLRELARGAEPSLHGHAVAIGSLLVAALWEELTESGLSCGTSAERNDPEAIAGRARALEGFLPTLRDAAMPLVRAKCAGAPAATRAAVTLARSLASGPPPSVPRLRDLLARAGAPTVAASLHVDRAFLRSALACGRDMRERTTVFDLAFALGVLPARTEAVIERSGLCA